MNQVTKNKTKESLLVDVKAGFIISLIALPLCLGIATASGFPPIAGLTTAIIGGIVVSWLGSSSFTIKGPAAGLIVIALGAVTELGQGDLAQGYHQALAVGVGAGILQLIFALVRTAGLGICMSKSVVHGMLAAIGVIIVAKQAHIMLGVTPHAHEALGLLAEIPHSFLDANLAISLIGFASLLVLFVWPRVSFGFLKNIPAQLVVLLLAIPAAIIMKVSVEGGSQFMGMNVNGGPGYMVNLPASFLDGIAYPDFSAFFTLTSLKYILMFALVGTVESTLSVVAVDALKEYKYPSNLNRDLIAVSIGNIIAAFLGGLPMISEIVRSKANVDAGAQSHRANFFHGCFLLLYLVALTDVIQLIPLAALAAMLVVTGLRLASVKEIIQARKVGKDQLILFLITLIVTLATDLLIGVAVGLLAKVVIHWVRGVSPVSLLKSKVAVEKEVDCWRMSISNNAAFPCLLKVRRALRQIKDRNVKVMIDVTNARLVDHTFLSGLDVVFSERPDLKRELVGLRKMKSVSDHPHSTHLNPGTVA